MDAKLLQTIGQIAGLGGLALGVALLLFRDVIRKNIYPRLTADAAAKQMRLITIAVWSIALVALLLWASSGGSGDTRAMCGTAIGGSVTGSTITTTATGCK
ncbi:hypothetical protein VZ95_12695 [Elstera litoralis]|uniref:Uncharacterized protein n=1 Tax=Elstera litoralis TaxID=552518 RepID=A0A0F3IRS0_9PROT|nr:hypothetical protein [Elstera litoralis]KJV09243.1 hypothetical protein VZ95_12695 [Elstera litoralis]